MRSLLITGCSTGIGATVARGLSERGWRVFATARKPEDVERLQAEGMHSLLLDLNDSASIQAAVDTVLAGLSRSCQVYSSSPGVRGLRTGSPSLPMNCTHCA